jgi:pimeloyl-ACP methyl ester carboxylesterase
MRKEHSVVFVPGLGDYVRLFEHLTRDWADHYGLNPVIHRIGWRDKEIDFQPKLQRLVKLIDELSNSGDTVSLVGVSAGASAVLNVFAERKEQVNKVVSVCDRLRTGHEKGFRSYEARFAHSRAFESSVEFFGRNEYKLRVEDRQKIMTVRAKFGDESVPARTSVLEGSYDKQIPLMFHMPSIIAALTVYSKPITIFLKEGINS